MKIYKKIRHFLTDKSGATAIEYGLIAALVTVAVIAGITLVGGENARIYGEVGENVIPVIDNANNNIN